MPTRRPVLTSPDATRLTGPIAGARRTAAGLLCLAGFAAIGAGCNTFDDRSQTMVPTRHGDVLLDIDRSGPQEIRVGEEFTYTIRLENTTDQPLHNVIVHETVDGDNFDMVSATPSPSQSSMVASRSGRDASRDDRGRTYGFDRSQERRSGDATAGSVGGSMNSWQIGHLDPGETRTIKVRALADSTGNMNSCMTVDYDLSVCTTMQAVTPALKLTRSVGSPGGDAVFYACDPVEVTYTVTNTGSASTRAGTIEEALPAGLRTADGSRSVQINVGALQPGGSVEKTVTLRASEALSYNNRATISSGNLSVRSNASEFRVRKPELELIVDGPGEDYLNRSLSNRVTVRNISGDPARDVMISTNLPDDITNLSFSSQRIERVGDNLIIGDLAPGETRTVTLNFDATEPGSLESSYTLTGYCVDEQTGRVATDVRGIPAVLIEVVDRADPVNVSDTAVYEIRVKNQGSADGLNIRLTAPVPQGMEFVRVDGDRSGSANGNMVVFDPIPKLGPGESQAWELYLRAIEPGRTRLELRMESDVTRSPIIEQESTTIID